MFCDRHRLMPKNSRNAPKRQTRIFYRNLQCFEPSQGRCEQSLYRAQGHFCWYLRCFLRFLAAHNGPFLGQNGPANLKFGTAPPPQTPPPKRSMPTTPSATALSVNLCKSVADDDIHTYIHTCKPHIWKGPNTSNISPITTPEVYPPWN